VRMSEAERGIVGRLICMDVAQRTAHVDTAEMLKALGKRFSAKAIADASSRLFGSYPSDSKGGGTQPPAEQSSAIGPAKNESS
jgi:hypothetical protein